MDRTNKTGITDSISETGDEFREIFNQSPIGILFYDKKMITVNANDSALEILGFPRLDDVLGHNLFDNHYIEGNKDELMDKGIIRFQAPLNLEKIKDAGLYSQKKGVLFLDYTVSVTNSGYLVQIQDITESEEKFSTNFLLDNVADAIIVCDSNFIITDWNKGAEEIYGWKAEEAIGKTTKFLKTRYPSENLEAEANQLIKHGHWSGELESTAKDGKILSLWASASLIKDEFGKTIGSMSVTHDFTKRKKAEEELKRRAVLLDASYEGIFSWEYGNGILSWNHGAERLYGYCEEEVIGSIPYELLKTEFPLDFNEFMEKIVKDKVWTGELIHTTKDGKKIIVESSLQLIRDISGKNIVIETNRDITERKNAEEQIRNLLEETQQAVEELEVSNEELQATTEELHVANEELRHQGDELLRVNQALRESEEYFRALAEALPQIVWTADAEGGIEWFSQNWYDYTGEPQGVGEGWSWDKVAHPDDMARTLKKWEEARKRGILFQNEIRVRRYDGQYRWFLVRAWPLLDADGNVVRWFGTNTDIHDMKVVEAAQRQSREDMDRAQEVGQIGSWRLDVRRDVLTWSDENYRIFGVPKGTPMTYETFLGIVHPDDRQYVDTQWMAGLAGEPYDIEHRIVVGEQVKWVREKAYLEFDDDDIVLGGFGITQDITDRKKLEEELRESRDNLEQKVEERTVEIEEAYQFVKESEARFHSLYENSFDAILLTKPDGSILAANPAAEKMFGMTNEEITKAGREGIVVKDEQLESALKERRQKGKVRSEFTFIRKDGSTFLGEATSSLFTDADGSVKTSMIIRDISERKNAEEAIKMASIYNRSLIEASLDPLVTIGPDGKINDVNTATELVTGYPRDDLIGTDFSDYFTEPQKAKFGYQRVFREGEVRDYPLEIKHKNGNLTPVLYNASVYRDESDEVIGVFAAARDITERKKVEYSLKETINELERSNHELESFAYITSHDLQEPLRTIASFTQLMERRYKGQFDSDADEFMDYIVIAAVRMKAMIQGLLEYSRVGKDEELMDFNAEEALKQTLLNMHSSIEECHADVTYENLPVIVADKKQISRVFQNLIGNALKFRKEEVQPKIHVSAEKINSEYIFSVQDNGIGIEQQYIDRIFEVFKRLHTIDEYQGTGIGLAVVKRIIEHHGGRVWVESVFGRGSTFYFTIPIND